MEFQLQHMVPLRRSPTLVSPELSLQHHNRWRKPGAVGTTVTSIGHHVTTNVAPQWQIWCHWWLLRLFSGFEIPRANSDWSMPYTHTHKTCVSAVCVCLFWILLRSTTIHYNPLQSTTIHYIHLPVIPQSPLPCQVCMTSGAGTYHWMAPEARVNCRAIGISSYLVMIGDYDNP